MGVGKASNCTGLRQNEKLQWGKKKRKTLTREGAYAGEEVIHPLEIGDLQANVHSELKADH